MVSTTQSRFSKEQMLAVANASPAAVGAHNKPVWLGLFSRAGRVEDPVGSSPHVRNAASLKSAGVQGAMQIDDPLDPFYETFIAPNKIVFDIDRDIVSGSHVMRDLTIVIRMSKSVVVRVPVHLLYELTEEGGELKISRLAAHWELLPMLAQQLKSGFGFLAIGLSSGLRMLRHLGLSGTIGFARAARSVGEPGKARVRDIVSCFNSSDAPRFVALAQGGNALVAFPFGSRVTRVADWTLLPGEISLHKVLAAGSVVSATIIYTVAGEEHHGVALFELERETLALTGLTFYWQN